jgi:hypothetical protein
MPEIRVRIRNHINDDFMVQVWDQFGGGYREVQGSPFPLAWGEQSPLFSVHANNLGQGKVAYRCTSASGPVSSSNIDVTDGYTVVLVRP